jgi:hypothetical protein
MPIIINEFEIIPTPAPDQQLSQTPPPPPEVPPSPDPEEIIRVQQRYIERQRRLRAD